VNDRKIESFNRLALASTVLTLIVVILGAFVRLNDAGLGCPDWPGCYGHLTVPQAEESVRRAAERWESTPLARADERWLAKAWKEMAHRYVAGILGLMVFALAVMAWRNRRHPRQPVKLPLFIAVLIVFQALLGMWTVTLLLKPAIVLLHLFGGLATLALLWLLYLRTRPEPPEAVARASGGLRRLSVVALAVLVLQIGLGGWTSTNYAALACPDFPTCQGQWWPETDFVEGFTLWRELGVDYEFGVLEGPARTAICPQRTWRRREPLRPWVARSGRGRRFCVDATNRTGPTWCAEPSRSLGRRRRRRPGTPGRRLRPPP
jgi:cytochrome c oxidase assembly protein subunit 15